MNKRKTPAIRFKGYQNDWEQRKLGDVYSERNERGNVELDILSVSIHHGISQNELDTDELGKSVRRSDDKSLYKHVYYGDLVFNMMRAWQGAIGVVKNEGMVSPAYISAIPDDSVFPEFMDYCLRRKRIINQINNLSYGVTDFRKRLYWEPFTRVTIMMPSVDEQRKITDIFHQLDELITLHQRKLEKLKILKKTMLENCFPQKGESVPRVRFGGFTGDWEQRKVGELTNVLSASRVHKEEWAEDGIPFFRSSDVVSAFKGTENKKAFISIELYEQLAKSSGKLEKNDILITGGGSIGIPYIVPDNKPLYSKDADLIWIKHSANFDSRYLYTYFISEEFREYLASISHMGTIPHYTIEQVKDTPVRLPSIDEQRELGDFFVSLDHLITLHQCKMEKLQTIKKSLLRSMFV